MAEHSEGSLEGRSILIVGASAGLGRELAKGVSAAGAAVTVAARRLERVTELCEELGGESLALRCDVEQPADCTSVVEQCVARFGRLDALIYSAGSSPLAALGKTTADEWHKLFTVNTIGAALTISAALDHLRSSRGRVVLMSSASAHDPKPGLVAYSASKSALETIARGWEVEEPDIAFTTIAIASTGHTEFAAGWDPDVFAWYLDYWKSRGQLTKGGFLSEEPFVDVVVNILASEAAIPHLFVGPRPDPTPQGS